MEKLVLEESEEITKKLVSTVDKRTFWFATSHPGTLMEIRGCENIDEEEVVFVNRNEDDKLDTGTVKGTQGFFHVRGEGRTCNGGEEGYPLHTSTIACACDVCLDGRFRDCVYLRNRGNVKTFVLRKKKRICNPANQD